MATDLEQIVAIRSALLASLVTEATNPKPTYNIDGQMVDWNGYRAAVMKQIADLNAMSTSLGGVYEEVGEATT